MSPLFDDLLMTIFKKKRYWVVDCRDMHRPVGCWPQELRPGIPPGMTRIAIGALGHAVIIFGLYSLDLATRRG